MNEEHRLEFRQETLSLAGINYLDIAPKPKSGLERTPPPAVTAKTPGEAAPKPELKLASNLTTAYPDWDALLSPKGSGTPTSPQPEFRRPIDNHQPYYTNPTSPDAIARATGHGLLGAGSLPSLIGGGFAAMRYGRGSLVSRAVIGLIVAGAIEVGKNEITQKVESLFGY